MSTRTSIELQEDVSRLVEVDVADTDEPGRRDVRVRMFATDVPGTDDPVSLEEALRRLRRGRSLSRHAVVTVWGLGAVHRLLRLADGPAVDLETRARAEVAHDLDLLERHDGRALVAVFPGETQPGSTEREVSIVAVPESALESRLRAVMDAGFHVDRAVTPSLALLALAHRFRHENGIVVYVALTASATCITAIRDRSLLLARELDWGYLHEADETGIPGQLTAELRRSMHYVHQVFRHPVAKVVLCGDWPSLRSAVAPLEAALGVRLETLDSHVGIDVESAPEPAETFRAQISALRIAIAAGADLEPPASLLPKPPPDVPRLRRRAVLAGAAMLCVALAIYALFRWPPIFRPERAQTSESAAPSSSGSSSTGEPAKVTGATPVDVAPAARGAPNRTVSVTTILYSANRRLAIVDGHVVGIGDRVGPDTVFDIRPRAVIFEGPDGRRWTAPLQTH